MTKICKECRKEFEDTSPARNKTFCSLTCSRRWWNWHYRDKQKKTKQKETRYCIICGRELSGFNTKYCSYECRRKGVAIKRGCKSLNIPVTCPICGKEFIRQGTRQKYCSKDCANKAIADKQKSYRDRKEKDRKCIVCGKELNHYNIKYCSRECRFKDKNFEPNRCMICGGIIPDKYGATYRNYVICEGCVSKTGFLIDPKRIYHGVAKDSIIEVVND